MLSKCINKGLTKGNFTGEFCVSASPSPGEASDLKKTLRGDVAWTVEGEVVVVTGEVKQTVFQGLCKGGSWASQVSWICEFPHTS